MVTVTVLGSSTGPHRASVATAQGLGALAHRKKVTVVSGVPSSIDPVSFDAHGDRQRGRRGTAPGQRERRIRALGHRACSCRDGDLGLYRV